MKKKMRKGFIEVVKASYDLTVNPPLFNLNDESVKELSKKFNCDYPIIHHDKMCTASGIYFSAVRNIRTLFGDVPAIFVDDYFFKLPFSYQKVFIQHEIGHIKNGDLKKVNKMKSNNNFLRALGNKELKEMEVKADLYASEVIGNIATVKNALLFIANEFSVNKKEIKFRIKRLQSI